VVPELSGLIASYPLHERFYALLMVALSRCGRRADALAIYRRAHVVLARELRVEPGPVLRQARAAIMAADGTDRSRGHLRRLPCRGPE